MTEPIKIPNSLPNIVNLRSRARGFIKTTSDTPLSHKEALAVAWIAGRELGVKGYQSPLLQQVHDDLWEQRLPRFTTMYAWLQSYSLFSQYPVAVTAIAKYLLGDSTQSENAQIDWEAARQMFGTDLGESQRPQHPNGESRP